MTRYLIRLADAEFDDIPNKVVPRTVRLKDPSLEGARATAWIFSGYCEKLLHKNEKLQELLSGFAGKFDDPECRSCLTQGQRILYSLGALDGQVRNGGMTQFFWNCPDLIFEASEALASIGETELTMAYDKALEGLIRNRDDWLELRRQSSTDPSNFWEPFQASYDLLNLSWFDDAYFDRYGPSLVARLVSYVKSHKGEFVKSSGKVAERD
jgi:hypothetical protein